MGIKIKSAKLKNPKDLEDKALTIVGLVLEKILKDKK